MSDESTASAPSAAPETASAPAEAAPQASAPDLAPEEIDAITGATDESGETVTIGGVEVPISALGELPDDVLGKIRRKVKVSGEEREISLAEALQQASLAGGAHDKMREAARVRKEAEALQRKMLSDPLGAIRELAAAEGISRQQAEDLVLRQVSQLLDYDAMSPEQRAEHDKRAEMERRAAEHERWEREQITQRTQQETQQVVAGALERHQLTGDARAERNVAMVAEGIIADLISAGRIREDRAIPPQLMAAVMDKAAGHVAQSIEQERARERDAWLEVDDDDALIERIGPERARRIAKAIAAKAKKAAAPQRRPLGASPPAPKPRSFADIRAELERKDREGAW